MMSIGPVDKWITEARDDELLPIADVSDREALEQLFRVACRENWHPAQRRCIAAQPTWERVLSQCEDSKVWWHAER